MIHSFQNAKKSTNRHLRTVIGDTSTEETVSHDVSTNILWLPNRWDDRDYPSIRPVYLSRGEFVASRRCYRAMLQLDTFTDQYQEMLADQTTSALLNRLGIDLDNQILGGDIPHFNWEGDQSRLQDMSLELIEGPETGPETDDEKTHIWVRFYLYFRQ